jgi:hypothetical protein
MNVAATRAQAQMLLTLRPIRMLLLHRYVYERGTLGSRPSDRENRRENTNRERDGELPVWQRSGLGSDSGAADLGWTGDDGMDLPVGGVFAAWPSQWRRLSGLGSATVGRTGGDLLVGGVFAAWSSSGSATVGQTGGDLPVGGVFVAWSSPGSGRTLQPSRWQRLSGLGSPTVGRTGGDGAVGGQAVMVQWFFFFFF